MGDVFTSETPRTSTEAKQLPPTEHKTIKPTIGNAGFITNRVGLEPRFCREQFGNDHRQLLAHTHRFSQSEIYPFRDNRDRQRLKMVHKWLQRAAAQDLAAVAIPGEFGGMQLDLKSAALTRETLAAADAPDFMLSIAAHSDWVMQSIFLFGQPAQRTRYLPGLSKGKLLGAYCIAETNSSSDLHGMQTRAVASDDGKYFILNGNKQFVTNGAIANTFLVFAKSESGLSAFIVDGATRGLNRGREEQKLGLPGLSLVSISLDNVRIPQDQMLSAAGDGETILAVCGNLARLNQAAAIIGSAREILKKTITRSNSRWRQGRPIGAFDLQKGRLADMAVDIFALDSVVYRIAGAMDDLPAPDPMATAGGRRLAVARQFSCETMIARIFSSEMIWRIVDDSMQIYGSASLLDDSPVARYFQDHRAWRINDQPVEVLRQQLLLEIIEKILLEEIPFREVVRLYDRQESMALPLNIGKFSSEITVLESWRQMIVLILRQILLNFGRDIRHYQQVIDLCSRMISGYFAAESVLTRVQYLVGRGKYPQIHRKIAQLALARYFNEPLAHLDSLLFFFSGTPDFSIFSRRIELLAGKMRLPIDQFALKADLAAALQSEQWFFTED